MSSSSSFAPLGGGTAEPRLFRGLDGAEPAAGPKAGPTATDAPPSAAEAKAAEPPHPEPSEERQAFQAGYELGREETRSQIESIGESLAKSLQELAAFRNRLRAHYERELLELALGVARKVVQQELAERPEIWLGMIRHAVRHAVDRERIIVRVPARLNAFLKQSLPELRASLEDVKEFELIEDPALRDGGCIIESRFGDIDIGVDTQFETTKRALLRAEE
jgi:flagellar assembly protein FliH